jgi:hypothetical protein
MSSAGRANQQNNQEPGDVNDLYAREVGPLTHGSGAVRAVVDGAEGYQWHEEMEADPEYFVSASSSLNQEHHGHVVHSALQGYGSRMESDKDIDLNSNHETDLRH